MNFKLAIVAVAAGAMVGTLINTQGCSHPPPVTAPATKPKDPVKEIEAQIDKGIALLEAGKNREALEALANPETVKKWKTGDEFDGVVSDFEKQGKAAELLAALKAAKTQIPMFDSKIMFAEFPHSGNGREIKFEKKKDENRVEGWYLSNN